MGSFIVFRTRRRPCREIGIAITQRRRTPRFYRGKRHLLWGCPILTSERNSTSVSRLIYNNKDRFQQNFQIEPQRPVLDVIEIMVHARTRFEERVYFTA